MLNSASLNFRCLSAKQFSFPLGLIESILLGQWEKQIWDAENGFVRAIIDWEHLKEMMKKGATYRQK